MRKLLLTLGFLGYCAVIEAQENNVEEPLVPHVNNWSLGIGIGMATMYGDLDQHVPKMGERLGIGKHITHSLMIGAEFYNGNLESQESPNDWTAGLTAVSKFYSMDLDAKVNLSVLFSNRDTRLTRFLSAWYIGSGIGYVNSSLVSFTQNRFKNKPNDTLSLSVVKNQDKTYYIPLNVGFRVPLNSLLGSDRTLLMVNFNECYTNSDHINGVDLGELKGNKGKRFHNVYSMITLGLSFALQRSDRIKKHKEEKEPLIPVIDSKGTKPAPKSDSKPKTKPKPQVDQTIIF